MAFEPLVVELAEVIIASALPLLSQASSVSKAWLSSSKPRFLAMKTFQQLVVAALIFTCLYMFVIGEQKFGGSNVVDLVKAYPAGSAVFLCLLGIGFYNLRETFTLTYAFVEFGVAALVASGTKSSDGSTLGVTTAILTSVYLVVRASDNFVKGWKKINKAYPAPPVMAVALEGAPT